LQEVRYAPGDYGTYYINGMEERRQKHER